MQRFDALGDGADEGPLVRLGVRRPRGQGSLVDNARAKRQKKQVDWILANDVSGGAVFGAANNAVTLVTGDGADAVETWPELSKSQVAARLVARIVEALEP